MLLFYTARVVRPVIYFAILVGVLVIGLSKGHAATPRADSDQITEIKIPYVATPVTIDGTMSPGEWDDALMIPVDGLTPETNPGWNPLNGNAIALDDLSYDLYVRHDGTALYVAFDVTDDSLSDDYTSTRPDHTEVWNDDCTEVFIDGDFDRDTTESAFGAPAGDNDWAEGQQPHFGILGNHHWDNNSGNFGNTWTAVTTRHAGGYRTEYRFDFTGIDTHDGEGNSIPAKPGDTIGFSALVNDDDNGGPREDQLAWIGQGADDSLFRSQYNWGMATLEPQIPNNHGIGRRVSNESLLIDCVPEVGVISYTNERVFPQLNFEIPVLLIESPDASGRLFVVEQRGQIRSFIKANDPAPGAATTFLDIADMTRSPLQNGGDFEEGLLGLTFDPDFSTNGEFYVYYIPAGGTRRSRVSRFTANPPNSATVNVSTEEVLLEFSQPAGTHNGGMMQFGPDNMLYIGTGDGGGVGDNAGAGNNAQNTTNLLGSMLRIDVRGTPDSGLGYAIPHNNPFVGGGSDGAATRKEIWAYGFRNPWRWSFDRQTGSLLLADVGQDEVEEINIVQEGLNYGWRIMEGSQCYNPSTGCNTADLTLPIAEYTHEFGNSITGGFVYYGASLPEFTGKFIYGDYGSGIVWALDYNAATGSAIGQPELITDLNNFGLAAFGQDQAGEVYLLSANDGSIHTIVEGSPVDTGEVVTTNPSPPVPGQPVTITYDSTGRNLEGQPNVFIHMGRNGWTNVILPNPQMTNERNNRFSYTYNVPADTTVLDMVFNNGDGTWDNNDSQDWHISIIAEDPCGFPQKLSDMPHLLRAGLGDDQTHFGIIPYEPISPLWSDGAAKERFIALPNSARAEFREHQGWDFPNETVLIKNFILSLDERDPENSQKRIETRLMVRNSDSWYGYSYEWNENETDATLLPGSKQRGFTITDESGNDLLYTWHYPSRNQCTRCHTDAANNVLGIQTPQLNHEFLYPSTGIEDNQLRTIDHIELLTSPLPDVPSALSAMPDPFDESAPLNLRARAYLAANCAQCHQPGGGGSGNFDLRWELSDEATGIIEGTVSNDLGITNAKLIASGAPERSIIYQRMNSVGPEKMPPLGRSRIDEDAVALLEAWINSLAPESSSHYIKTY